MSAPRYSHSLALAGLVALLLAGCASSSEPGQRRDLSLITYNEIEEATASAATAHDLVQRLRPQWLRKRGRSNVGFEVEVMVYVDGARYGGADMLAQIPSLSVTEMRYLRPSEASDRYGANHDQGAILVMLR